MEAETIQNWLGELLSKQTGEEKKSKDIISQRSLNQMTTTPFTWSDVYIESPLCRKKTIQPKQIGNGRREAPCRARFHIPKVGYTVNMSM